MEVRNLLVTGGCGFIGSNFIRYLLEKSDFSGRIVNVDKLTYAGNPENLRDLEERFEAGTVTIKELHEVGLIPRRCQWVKILGAGELNKKFVVKANAFSASAKDKIEKKGGRAEVVQD